MEHVEGAHPYPHQFDDLAQQARAVSLGMWVFLVTEIMFFGGLFTGYALYRLKYPLAYAAASHHLDVRLGAINTVVLITSSLTMALAVWAASQARKNTIILFLIVTMILGLVFLVIKSFEYAHKFEEHLVPGASFSPELQTEALRGSELFFSLYFAMTGTHALHMVIGVGAIAIILYQVLNARDGGRYAGRIEIMGLYWHFVDIVWIFLFPLLYLLGRH